MIDASIILAVQRAAHASAQALAAACHADGLSPAEANALANLSDGHQRTLSRLAVDVGVRPSTLTSLVDRLEGRGLLRRRPSSSDRRSILVSLTPAGRAAARRAEEAVAELEQQALGSIPREGRAALLEALRALAEVAS